MTENVADILKRSQLSLTDSRKRILQLFLQTDSALAHADIEKKAGEQFDRVTVYRTLQTFVEKGIIHTIPSPDNAVRYAMCHAECSEGHHHDDHVHFICDDCGTTYCLEDTAVPKVELPSGFTLRQTDLVASGRCGKCV